MITGDHTVGSLNVSRETYERLEVFADTLQRWNPKINLVSKSSISDLWIRHIIDSVQVFQCTIPKGHWVDLGSGGGFPGLVVGILARQFAPDLKLTLVESDQRKSAFLRTAARETGAQLTVLSKRIEQVEPLNADILSARALTDLSGLLGFAQRHLSSSGTALFPKGATWEKELAQAQREWKFSVTPITSITEPSSVVLRIQGVSRG